MNAMKTSTVLLIALAVVGILAPLTGLYPQFLMKCVALALFAVAFNFFTGNVGLLSIGHAAFFGMGAYAAGYATKAWDLLRNWHLPRALWWVSRWEP